MGLYLPRTKIVTTLGPSTDYPGILEKMITSGANVFRLNFSHGIPEDHIKRAEKIIKISKKLGIIVSLLGDLQGPKIRISSFRKKKIFLKTGDIFVLDPSIEENNGTETEVGVNYSKLPEEVKYNDILLLDDGRIQLQVIKIFNTKIITQVLIGGFLTNNKGLNKLGGGLSAESLTKKDKKDIKLAAKINVDFLAISFPRTAQDLKYARQLLNKSGSQAKIIAKIERAEAVKTDENIQNLILESDIIMIARGDLGVEIGDTKLIEIQKKLIHMARKLNRAVITATQMMESMVYNSFPTRAEVSDVANAVLDKTDAVMLSAETASGKFPIETIKKMSKICLDTEQIPCIKISKHRLYTKFDNISEAILMSSMYAANHLLNVSAILLFTFSSQSALISSRISTHCPIFIISSNMSLLKVCTIYRGVFPIFIKNDIQNSTFINVAINHLKYKKFIKRKDFIIIVQDNYQNQHSQDINMCRILKID
ncbi:pyruvate kinase [Buchnera aphidicola]|uniref:Pyruvate kinase n=1 Tax=Buchnera aphidicola subsp. Tuberolachnus salignus TaxID=98804 RepID=A0A160SXH0_BUCTT|nr:pyruvate kinase [Buchnera aphidicola]CUR53185.1 Pyruvate kinase II [Buchnera aphidicola (Tuberolachnus salignus)]